MDARQRADLDRYITGNGGEDQFRDSPQDPEDAEAVAYGEVEPEPEVVEDDDGGQAEAAERNFLDGTGGLGGGVYPEPNE